MEYMESQMQSKMDAEMNKNAEDDCRAPSCSLDSMRETLKNTGNPKWSRDWIRDLWNAMPEKLRKRTSLHDLREMGTKLEANAEVSHPTKED